MLRKRKLLGLVFNESDEERNGSLIRNFLHRLGGLETSINYKFLPGRIYFIDDVIGKISSVSIDDFNKDNFVLMTCEEFQRNCPFILGDIVKMKNSSYFGSISQIRWISFYGKIFVDVKHNDTVKLRVPIDEIEYLYESNKVSNIEYADMYSKEIWKNLMDKFEKIPNFSIGCNDVSDIVLNAILDALNGKKMPSFPKVQSNDNESNIPDNE